MPFFNGWFDPIDESDLDAVAPLIELVSPVTFDADFDVASITPVVINVTDLAPGLELVTISVSGAGFSGTQVVYANGSFVSPFTAGTAETITNGLQFSFKPSTGWAAGELNVSVVAVDGNGNLSSYAATWDIAAGTPAEYDGAAPFRDSVWRWRRRLARQKCSVISVAIDDNYTPGPGFTLTALALEVGRRSGLDRIPWRNGTSTNTSGSGTNSDGT